MTRSARSRRDDARLVGAARAGDRAAFAELVERHLDLARALCHRRIADPTTVEDVVQDAVLTALTGLDRLRDPASFGPWFAGIALNTARRSLHRRSADPLSLETVLGGLQLPDPSATPDAVVADLDEARRLAAAVTALPTGQAAAITAFYLHGLSLAETAEQLGASVTAVKNRLHKARRALRAHLVQHAEKTAEETTMTDETDLVAMRITAVRRVAVDDAPVHVVVLSDGTAVGTVPIWVGEPEAIAVALALDGTELPRPSTHRLTVALLAAAGGRVAAVEVVDLVDGVFHARIVLADGSAVDARPSDAVNIAALTGAPIGVARSVVERARAGGRTLPPGPSDHAAIAAEMTAALEAQLAGPGR